jgi:hypothetical protein
MSPRTVIAGVLRGRRPAGSPVDETTGRPVLVRTPDEGVAPAGTVWVEPLAGPLFRRPEGLDRRTAANMLLTAVDGLPMGQADQALIARATDQWAPADTAVLASLIERARAEGPSAWTAHGRPAAGAATGGFLPVCAPCGRRPVVEPVTLPEAESLARTHDVEHHGGAWTCDVVPAASSVSGGAR